MSTTEVAAPAGDSAPAAVKVSKRSSGKTASTKKAEHPTYREMISCALGAMKERKGTSRQKIQKYIVDTYKLDLSASNSHLKRALTSGVEKGAFLQTTGKGASGSFKLAKTVPMISAGPKRKKAKKPAAKKAAAKKRPVKKSAAKKATKKTAAKKRPVKKSAKKPAVSKRAASKKKVTKKKKKPAAKKAPSKKASTKKKSTKKC